MSPSSAAFISDPLHCIVKIIPSDYEEDHVLLVTWLACLLFSEYFVFGTLLQYICIACFVQNIATFYIMLVE